MMNLSERIFEEGKAEGKAEGRAEGKAEGIMEAIFSSVEDGDFPVKRGAEKLGISVDEFIKKYQETGRKLPPASDKG